MGFTRNVFNIGPVRLVVILVVQVCNNRMGVWDILNNPKTGDDTGIESAKREGDARARASECEREREKSGIFKLVDSKSGILQEMMILENRAGRKSLTPKSKPSTFYF